MRCSLRSGAARLGQLGLAPLREDTLRWQPPLKPGKVVGVAMNNSASDDRKISAPTHPMFFLKAPSSLVGHGQDIEIRDYYGSVHPEPEIAVVIGRRGHGVPAQGRREPVDP